MEVFRDIWILKKIYKNIDIMLEGTISKKTGLQRAVSPAKTALKRISFKSLDHMFLIPGIRDGQTDRHYTTVW